MNEQPSARMTPAKRMATAGIVTAITIALLYLLYLLPMLRFSILFVVSLLPVILAHEKRYADAALSFAAAALLSGFLFPAKGAWLLYVAFFGWYGIVREPVVTHFKMLMSWVILFGVFNIAFFALYFLAGSFFDELGLSPWLRSLIIPAAEVAFLLFENLFGLCRDYYVKSLRKRIFRSASL